MTNVTKEMAPRSFADVGMPKTLALAKVRTETPDLGSAE